MLHLEWKWYQLTGFTVCMVIKSNISAKSERCFSCVRIYRNKPKTGPMNSCTGFWMQQSRFQEGPKFCLLCRALLCTTVQCTYVYSVYMQGISCRCWEKARRTAFLRFFRLLHSKKFIGNMSSQILIIDTRVNKANVLQ